MLAPDAPLVIYGESLGTTVATMLAAETQPAGVLLDSSFASALSVVVLGDESGYVATEHQQMKIAAMGERTARPPSPPRRRRRPCGR